MTERELVEKIAQKLYEIMGWRQVWDALGEHHRSYWRTKAAQILILIKEAGGK